MLVTTTVHCLLGSDASLTESQLLEARELVVWTKQDRWATKHEIELFEDDGLEYQEDTLEDLAEFTNTAWDFVDGSIVYGLDNMRTPTAGKSKDRRVPLQQHVSSIEQPQTLSYIEGDILGLIPHVSGISRYNIASIIKPPLPVHKDTPAALVARYMHPSMPHFYPESLLDPTGALTSSTQSSNLSSSAQQIDTNVDRSRWLHTRVAWLVPIRGHIPWTETSEGRILTDDGARVKSPYGFWKHLIRHQRLNTLGPIAFALIPATKGSLFPDMIKVWCDSEMAMKVRTLLSVFYAEPSEGIDASETGTKELRAASEMGGDRKSRMKTGELEVRGKKLITPLRRCRLVLLDDRGDPLLIS